MFRSLRSQALTVSPASTGISQGTGRPSVFGVIMDTTYPSGTATLAVLADGTVSLYTTTGGGVIGGGSHERVAAAARELLAVAEGHLASFAQGGPGDLPPTGGTLITLRTHAGPRSLSASETDLSLNRHPASPVYRSAHQVIAQLRMTESGTGQDRGGTERFPGEVTPLMAAAHHGDQQAVAHWIDQGIPIDAKDDKGYTALMYAANAGQDEIVRLLLASNADPDVSDNQHSTPLMFAAQHGHLSIVRQLLAAHADSRARGTHGLTALGFAQQNGHDRIAAILISAGAA